jgi:uncharacterized cupredoxin-like copper-binding protein
MVRGPSTRGIVSAAVRRPTAARAALLACPIAVVAGCGGDDEEAVRSATVPAGGTQVVVGREYSFDPNELTVQGRGPVRVRLDNRGDLAHNLRVQEPGGRALGGTRTIEAGATADTTLRLPPGDYRMICTVGDHAELGMTGTLRVQD